MGNSLIVSAALLGSSIRIASPKALWPGDEVQAIARDLAAKSGAEILLTEDMDEALPGADFVHTDVWVSMGESEEIWAQRVELLGGYQVNDAALARTGNPNAKFMHCLPSFHNTETAVGRQMLEEHGITAMEVTDEVFESPASVVFAQAENRLHPQKALLLALLG